MGEITLASAAKILEAARCFAQTFRLCLILFFANLYTLRVAYGGHRVPYSPLNGLRRPKTRVEWRPPRGKKKTHTVKNNLIIDQQSQILFLSNPYPGSVDDKRLAQEAGHYYPDKTVLVEDLGYEPDKIRVVIPDKKHKKGERTQQQKQDNTHISQVRVPVEHVMAGIKRLNIVKESGYALKKCATKL